MITARCQTCGHERTVPEKFSGKKFRCKECQSIVDIPRQKRYSRRPAMLATVESRKRSNSGILVTATVAVGILAVAFIIIMSRDQTPIVDSPLILNPAPPAPLLPRLKKSPRSPGSIDTEKAVQAAKEKSRQRVAVAFQEAKSRRWDRAFEICNEAIQLDSGNVDAYRLRGQAELNLGVPSQALISFKKVRNRVPPGELDANLLLSMIEAYKKSHEDSSEEIPSLLAEVWKALEREPNNHEAIIKLLIFYEESDDEKGLKKLREFTQAQKIDLQKLRRLNKKYPGRGE